MIKELWKEYMGKDGRHYLYSQRTGHTYWIEVIDEKQDPRPTWGDQSVTGGKINKDSYVSKTRRGIHPNESIITPGNGFKNIEIIPRGSPYYAINKLDAQYPTLDKDKKEHGVGKSG